MIQGEFESLMRKAKVRAEEARADLLEAEVAAKAAVKHKPWPWIVGALVIGFIAGAVLL